LFLLLLVVVGLVAAEHLAGLDAGVAYGGTSAAHMRTPSIVIS
jgi:hypothetical protein